MALRLQAIAAVVIAGMDNIAVRCPVDTTAPARLKWSFFLRGSVVFKSLIVLAAAAAAFSSAPALAVSGVSIVTGECASVTDAHGCLFQGNVAPLTAPDVPLVYNLFNDTNPAAGLDIAMTYLYKSDDAGFAGTVTGSTSGSWATPDAVGFIAVKAANYFVLYQLAAPATSGNWSTLDIPFNRNPHGLSHIAFFSAPGGTDIGIGPGPGVPEPASWALMIAGFGMVGTALRRRKAVLAA